MLVRVCEPTARKQRIFGVVAPSELVHFSKMLTSLPSMTVGTSSVLCCASWSAASKALRSGEPFA